MLFGLSNSKEEYEDDDKEPWRYFVSIFFKCHYWINVVLLFYEFDITALWWQTNQAIKEETSSIPFARRRRLHTEKEEQTQRPYQKIVISHK